MIRLRLKVLRRSFQVPESSELKSHFSVGFHMLVSFRKMGWEMWFAFRILKSYNVELEESTADHPIQPAHLGDGETERTFPLDLLNQKTSLNLLSSFFPLFLALFLDFSWWKIFKFSLNRLKKSVINRGKGQKEGSWFTLLKKNQKKILIAHLIHK